MSDVIKYVYSVFLAQDLENMSHLFYRFWPNVFDANCAYDLGEVLINRHRIVK